MPPRACNGHASMKMRVSKRPTLMQVMRMLSDPPPPIEDTWSIVGRVDILLEGCSSYLVPAVDRHAACILFEHLRRRNALAVTIDPRRPTRSARASGSAIGCRQRRLGLLHSGPADPKAWIEMAANIPDALSALRQIAFLTGHVGTTSLCIMTVAAQLGMAALTCSCNTSCSASCRCPCRTCSSRTATSCAHARPQCRRPLCACRCAPCSQAHASWQQELKERTQAGPSGRR